MGNEWIVGPRPRRPGLPLLEPIALIGTLGALLLFRDEFLALTHQQGAALSVLIALFAGATIIRRAPRGVWSPSSAFYTTFSIFHFGLLLAVALDTVPETDTMSLSEWLDRPSTQTAMWLVSIAALAMALGVRFAYLWRPLRARRPFYKDDFDRLMGITATMMVLLGIGSWMFIAISSGGIGILFGSYGTFLTKTGDATLPFIYYVIHLAIVLAAAASSGRSGAHLIRRRTPLDPSPGGSRRAARWTVWSRLSFGLFGAWGLIVFPLGLRGEILFPAVSALAIMATRRAPTTTFKALLLAIGVLSAVSFVRGLRNVGVSELTPSHSKTLSFNPLIGAMEMGASLRPTSEVVFWRETGDPFDNGASYWAPIDRVLIYVIPGWTRPPADKDDRLLGNLVMKRSGPIGFSIVAEAYRNFSVAGVVLVLFLVGGILGRIDVWPNTRIHQAVGGTFMTTLLGHIRNSFTPVPMHLLVGLTFIFVLTMLARMKLNSTA